MPMVSLTDPLAFLFQTAGKAPASTGENTALVQMQPAVADQKRAKLLKRRST